MLKSKKPAVYPLIWGSHPDDAAETERIFRAALAKADALITSGGVSVGEHDVVKTVLAKLGEINFWRVAMKPRKTPSLRDRRRETDFRIARQPRIFARRL